MTQTRNIPRKTFARAAATTLCLAFASLALVAGSAQAQSHGSRGGSGYYGGGHGYHGGGHYGPGYGYRRGGGGGWVWGGLGLGLGLGLASYYASPWYGYAEPGYVVVDPPVVYSTPQTVVYSQPVPARSSTQPVIYPRNGQSAAKMESDADSCSQWAGQQPNATVDPSVFQRATQACMDARGYTVR